MGAVGSLSQHQRLRPAQLQSISVCCERGRKGTLVFLGFLCGSVGKESACSVGDLVRSLVWEDPLEKGKAILSSILT